MAINSTNSSPKTTRVSLPDDVYYRWDELLERYVTNPDEYDYTPDQVEHFRACRASPRKHLKTRTVLSLAHYGADDPRTLLSASVLKESIYDAYELMQDISFQQESVLQRQLNHWITHASFNLAAPKAPTPKDKSLIAFRQEVERETHAMVKHACKLLQRAASPVQAPASFSEKMEVKISWHPNRRRSNGGFIKGRPRLSLALCAIRPDRDVIPLREYKHIRESPVIGSCEGPWQVFLATLVAHEVAHAAQYAALHSLGFACKDVHPKLLKRTHGEGWQEIYRYLRESWVNQMPGWKNV